MRVLIVSAFLAYAAAAPSGIVAPVFYQPIAFPAAFPAAIPAAVPTLSPGDIQAAAIDAQVKINDLARAAADKAIEFADLSAKDINEKVVTDVDQVNEKNLEAFWSNEEKKWQAIDAVKTAEAQLDGAAASNAELYAKTAVGGAVPYIAPGVPVVTAPLAPVVYNPYLSTLKTLSPVVEIKAEDKKEDNQAVAVDAAVKSTELEKAKVELPIEKPEEKPLEKAIDLFKKSAVVINPFPSLYQPYQYNVVPAVSPYVAQPILKYAAFPIHGALTPTFVQKVW